MLLAVNKGQLQSSHPALGYIWQPPFKQILNEKLKKKLKHNTLHSGIHELVQMILV